ncbi:MAG: hypothetical protein ACK6A4_00885, partial [Alphaproteobacteria bacterium]
MRDQRFGAVHRRQAMHEGRRAKGGLPRKTRIEKHTIVVVDDVTVRGRQLHHQLVWMLPVDQRRHAVCGFACCEQKRIAALAHEWIGAKHRAKIQHVTAIELPPRRCHEHARDERLLVTARAILPIVDAVEHNVAHGHPTATHLVTHHVRGHVGLPAGA